MLDLRSKQNDWKQERESIFLVIVNVNIDKMLGLQYVTWRTWCAGKQEQKQKKYNADNDSKLSSEAFTQHAASLYAVRNSESSTAAAEKNQSS